MVSSNHTIRFPIRFDEWYKILSNSLLLAPLSSYVEIDGSQVRVQMGWAFRSRFPLSSITSTAELNKKPLSIGVHGFAGRWLVNGSRYGIVSIDLNPPQRAYVLGFPIRLKQLLVSINDPIALRRALMVST
jgi:hypothetical protein